MLELHPAHAAVNTMAACNNSPACWRAAGRGCVALVLLGNPYQGWYGRFTVLSSRYPGCLSSCCLVFFFCHFAVFSACMEDAVAITPPPKKCGVCLSLHIVLERIADSGHFGQLGPRGHRWADKPFGDVAAGNLCPEVSWRAQSGRVGADFWFSGRHIPPTRGSNPLSAWVAPRYVCVIGFWVRHLRWSQLRPRRFWHQRYFQEVSKVGWIACVCVCLEVSTS